MNVTFEPYFTEILKKLIPCLKVKIRLIRELYASRPALSSSLSGHSGLNSFPALTLLGQKLVEIRKDKFIIIIIIISFSFSNNAPPPPQLPNFISLLP